MPLEPIKRPTPAQAKRMLAFMRDVYETLKEKRDEKDIELTLYEWAWLAGLEDFFQETQKGD